MKYAAFPFLLLLFSCGINPVPKHNNSFAQKTLPALTNAAIYHNAWTRAQKNAVLWVVTPGASEHKQELQHFITNEYPAIRSFYESLAKDSLDDHATVTSVIAQSDRLVALYKNEISTLNSVAAYNDPAVALPMQGMLLDGDGDVEVQFRTLDLLLTNLDLRLQKKAQQQSKTF